MAHPHEPVAHFRSDDQRERDGACRLHGVEPYAYLKEVLQRL